MLGLGLLLATGSLLSHANAQSGTGKTTRYWDCCKGVCSYDNVVAASSPAAVCDKSDNPFTDYTAVSGCDGGNSFMCSTYAPFGVGTDLAYGFAGVNVVGQNETNSCCSCYALSFTDGPVTGRAMIVQALSTSYNQGENQFDLLIPGAGVGGTGGCAAEYGDVSGWGDQFGGVWSREDCNNLPDKLKAGCYWRFDWFRAADNPSVSFTRVGCPKELTDISGCRRDDDPAPVASISSRTTTLTSTTIPVTLTEERPTEDPATSTTSRVSRSQRTVTPKTTTTSSTTTSSTTTTSTTPSTTSSTTSVREPGGVITLTGSRTVITLDTSTTVISSTPQVITLTGTRSVITVTRTATVTSTSTRTAPSISTITTSTKPTVVTITTSVRTTTTTTRPSSTATPPTTTARPTAGRDPLAYEQCGGNNYVGTNKCPAGFKCVFVDEWYSQCQDEDFISVTVVTRTSTVTSGQVTRASTTVATTTRSTAAPKPGSTGVSQIYEQCYGQSWQGPTKCAEGLVCSVTDQWYGQCVRQSDARR